MSRGSVSRRGLLVLGAGSFAAGCSSSDRTEKLPASDPGKPVDGGVQDRLRRPVPSALTRTADLQTGRGLPRERGLAMIPREIRPPPPSKAEPLLGRPPGRVLLKLETYNGDAPTAHFLTAADEWRVVHYPDLGLPPGFRSLWRDAWSGSVSSDGRFWGFPIHEVAREATRVVVVDLETLEMRILRADRFPGWSAAEELVLDEPPVRGVQRMRVLDPETGRIRRYRTLTPRNISDPVYARSGGMIRLTRTRDWREGLTAIEYDGDFAKGDETRLPLSFGHDIWAPTALSSRHVAMGIQVRQHGRRSTGVLIADRNWNPQALLLDRRRGHPPRPHWIAPDVLLLHHGMAMHSATAVLHYDCRSGSLTRVATVEAPSDPRTGLLFDFARDLVHG